jgi:hypothetical protein
MNTPIKPHCCSEYTSKSTSLKIAAKVRCVRHTITSNDRQKLSYVFYSGFTLFSAVFLYIILETLEIESEAVVADCRA